MGTITFTGNPIITINNNGTTLLDITSNISVNPPVQINTHTSTLPKNIYVTTGITYNLVSDTAGTLKASSIAGTSDGDGDSTVIFDMTFSLIKSPLSINSSTVRINFIVMKMTYVGIEITYDFTHNKNYKFNIPYTVNIYGQGSASGVAKGSVGL